MVKNLSDKPIRTFAIGMESDPIDLKYAKQVADYLGTEHTEVIMNKEDLYQHLKEVIYHLETFVLQQFVRVWPCIFYVNIFTKIPILKLL